MAFRDTESAIGRAIVVPVVREESAGAALSVASWLIDQGLDVVELTASTRDWERAVDALEGVVVGVGTLRTREDAQRAVAAGARFLVSPCPAPDVRAVADAAGLPLLEGGFTPGEVLAATDRGIAKLFPASAAPGCCARSSR